MNRFYLFSCLVLLIGYSAFSQVSVSGKVTDAEDASELIGVTVVEKGTSNGTVTDIEGGYTLNVSEGAVLIFNYIGYKPVETSIGNQTIIDVALSLDIEELDEVVIVAYGMEKSKRALGFAQTEVAGDELVQAKEISVANMLYGKVSGTAVIKPATGPAGSTKISIRGSNSFGADRDALIVVDGVPINNTRVEETGQYGGIDRGDAFSSINPDDIESVNVLKGATAGTLYGERGANGVIIITTKKGSKDLTVEYNGNYSFDTPAFFADFYQNQYGQGVRGERPGSQIEAVGQWSSWGEELDGADFIYYDGVTRPYSAAPENDVKNFYETGYTMANNLAISGGNDLMTSRLSFSHTENEGIVPNSTYERYTANLASTLEKSDRFSLSMKATYVFEDANNRTNNGDFPSNPGRTFINLPVNISADMLKETLVDTEEDDITKRAIPWNDNVFVPNPFWGTDINQQADSKRRLTGFIMGKYSILDNLSLQVRYALDWTKLDAINVIDQGSEWQPDGSYSQGTRELNDNTIDVILNYNGGVSNFGYDINAGAVENPRSSYTYTVSGSNFIVPGLYHINNMLSKTAPTYNLNERNTRAIYGNGTFDYKKILYVEGSIRQDWYSTLSTSIEGLSDNTTLYASGSASAIVSDMVTLPTAFSYLKVRAAYGNAGSANIGPYQILPVYGINGDPYIGEDNTTAVAQITNGTYANAGLTPTITKSLEIGLDASFLNNRIRLNATYYKENTTDNLLQVDVSNFTGYGSTWANVGDIENKGIELALDFIPVQNGDLQWDVSLNYTRNENLLVELIDGLDAVVGEQARFNAFIRTEVGEQVGNIYGTAFERDDSGNIIYDSNGLPIIQAEEKNLGNYNPDFFGGITNTLTYKNFSLSVLVDYKIGGEIFSLSNSLALSNGKHIETLEGRDNPFFEIIGEGVTESGEENKEFVFLDQYYGQLANIAEYNMFDASFVKIRQVILNYNLPGGLLEKLPFSAARVGFTGRNLLFLYSGLADLGIDPEALYNTNANGFEYASIPTTRSLGFNLYLKF